MVDPIDGTRAFIAGFPDWTIVGGAGRGRPADRGGGVRARSPTMFSSRAQGAGARVNGLKVQASGGTQLDDILVGGPKRRLDALAALAPRIRAAPRIRSLALRIARVATGALDAAFAGPATATTGTLRRPILLVHEAGGLH